MSTQADSGNVIPLGMSLDAMRRQAATSKPLPPGWRAFCSRAERGAHGYVGGQWYATAPYSTATLGDGRLCQTVHAPTYPQLCVAVELQMELFRDIYGGDE